MNEHTQRVIDNLKARRQRFYQRNKDKIRAYRQHKRAVDAANKPPKVFKPKKTKEDKAAYQREYYRKNRIKILEYHKRYDQSKGVTRDKKHKLRENAYKIIDIPVIKLDGILIKKTRIEGLLKWVLIIYWINIVMMT